MDVGFGYWIIMVRFDWALWLEVMVVIEVLSYKTLIIFYNL